MKPFDFARYNAIAARAVLVAIAILAVGVMVFPQPLDQILRAAHRLVEHFEQVPNPLIIACVGPLSGELAADGRDACDGAEFLVAEANAAFGPEENWIRLERFDDQDDPGTAEAIAEQIGRRNDIVAVIGNVFSSVSIPAGRIYAQFGLPAVTGFNTSPEVTANNPWYFRVLFDDILEADLVAIYLHNVLSVQRVGCVGLDNAYGKYLPDQFKRKLIALGVEVPVSVTLPVQASARQIDAIIAAITAEPQLDAVFLAIYGPATLPLVEGLRRAGWTGAIVGGDAVEPELLGNHGGYAPLANGSLLVMPFISEIGSVAAHQFEQGFFARYQHVPSWYSYYAYDAALTLITALQRAGALRDLNKAWKTGSLRRDIRNRLQAMDSIDNAVFGLTGPIYFDSEGDASQPIYFAGIENGQLRAAAHQLTLVDDPDFLEIAADSDHKNIKLDDDTLIEITDIVRTGLRLTSPISVHQESDTFEVDFDLWFRAGVGFNASQIRFLDAVEPIRLKQPSRALHLGERLYQAFSVHGRFFMHPTHRQLANGSRTLGIRYLDPTLDHSRLILVPDRARMGLSPQQQWGDLLKRDANAILPPRSGWILAGAMLGQGVVNQSTLGSPLFSVSERPHSILDASLEVKRDEVSIRHFLSRFVSAKTSWPSAIVLIALLGLAMLPWPRRQCALGAMLLRLSLITLLLFLAERLLAQELSERLTTAQLDALLRLFGSLWWLLPALWIIVLLPYLVWRPLERKSGYPTPAIARILTNVVVVAVSVLCVAAFEFHFSPGSIGVISGALTVVLGFALQSLIADLFSGLLLNIERPFQVGQWLEINHRFMGKVYGRVTELHWRTTRIWTRNNDAQVLPNSLVSQSRITNFSLPAKSSAFQLPVTLDFTYATDDVIRVLTTAAREASEAKGMVAEPMPNAYVENTGDHGILYMVEVYHNHDLSSVSAARTATMRTVQKHLNAAGMAFSFPVLRVRGDLAERQIPSTEEQEPAIA